MFTISLHGIVIHALLGLFPEEQKVPNRFEVDVALDAPEDAPFIDYGVLREAVDTVMHSGKYQMLEAVCKALLDGLHERFPQAVKGTVTIRKYTLPFGAPVCYSQVRLVRQWE